MTARGSRRPTAEAGSNVTPHRRARRSRADDAAADALFDSVRPLVEGIAATFGRWCEVVLHDYRRQDHSVIAVAGNVTGRQVGSPMSQIGLALWRQGDSAEDELNYVTRTNSGRVIKSSTILLRIEGHVIGALCINYDVTDLRLLGKTVGELTGDVEPGDVPATTFSNDIEAVIDQVLLEIQDNMGQPLSRLTVRERMEVFRMLDERGVFQVRRSVPLVAERLDLSRASVYNYIARLRDDGAAEAD